MPSESAGQVTRLFVLGTLERGPAHGHEIRRWAERIDVEHWGDAPVGSIYNALRRLETEGLIEAIRTEQEGRRPTRTVYAMTDSGRLELATLRDRMLHEIAFGSDPFDVTLWVSAQLPADVLESAIDRRCAALEERRARLEHERQRLTTAGYLPVIGQLLIRHGEVRVGAELEWHRELRLRLGELGR